MSETSEIWKPADRDLMKIRPISVYLTFVWMLTIPRLLWGQTSEQLALDNLVNQLQAGKKVTIPLRESRNSEYQKWPVRVHIDGDVGYVTVTKDPGKSWEDCRDDQAQCFGWLDSESIIDRDPSAAIMEKVDLNPATGEPQVTQFMKVKFKYQREFNKLDGTKGSIDKEGVGWIEVDALRKEQMAPIYREPTPRVSSPPPKQTKIREPVKSCDKSCVPASTPKTNLRDIEDLASFINRSPNDQLEAATKLVSPMVGECPLRPPTEKKVSSWKGKNIYDAEALPLIKQKTKKMPLIPKLSKDGKTVETASADDLVAIDNLARTVYSEMNECFHKGIQYPMAAAKVALNRADLLDAGKGFPHFGRGPQAYGKPTISKVLTAPYQFSVWNHIGAANPKDKTVLMSLCPARDESKNNWRGGKPSPRDREAWDMAVKIATEAVLFRPRFDAKTSGIKQTYYTSKRSEYDGRSRPHPAPQIMGRTVESYQCMYLWQGK